MIFLALQLTPIEISVVIFSGLGFIIMFGLASSQGGYQDLIKTTLKNDEISRKKNRKS